MTDDTGHYESLYIAHDLAFPLNIVEIQMANFIYNAIYQPIDYWHCYGIQCIVNTIFYIKHQYP